MTDLWARLAEAPIAGKYTLEELLASDAGVTRFRTRFAGRPAVIALALTGEPGGEERFEQWKAAAQVSHPHVVRVFEVGRTEAAGTPLAYAVAELPDEDLGSVLHERPLSAQETGEVLRAVLDALTFLHARGLALRGIEARDIVAVADVVKISSGALRQAGAVPGAAAEDVRSLGLCLYEILMQSREPREEGLRAAPQPFQEIIRGCLRQPGEGRWTLRQIAAALDPPGDAPAPLPPPSRRRTSTWWKYGAALAGVAAIAAWLSRPAQQAPPVAPVARAAAPAPDRTPPPAPAVEQPPAPPAAIHSSEPAVWRVIAYTYSRRTDAEKEIHRIQRKWPDLRPEVFALDATTYFISLGGRMTRPEAMEVARQARYRGLPPDTFVRNFSR